MTLFREGAQLDKSNLPWGPLLKQYLQTFKHKYTDIHINTNKQKSSMPKVNYLLSNLDIHSWNVEE